MLMLLFKPKEPQRHALAGQFMADAFTVGERFFVLLCVDGWQGSGEEQGVELFGAHALGKGPRDACITGTLDILLDG
jgi:hypothetical protein